MNISRSLVAASLLLCIAPSIFAEDICRPSDSFDSCYQYYYNSKIPVGKIAATDMATAKAAAAKAQTGADSGGAATASTLTDLIPLFDAVGLIGSTDESGTLALNLSFLLPVQQADKNMQLQLLVNTSPEPLSQLVDAFPEAIRETRKDALQKELNTFADTRAALTYSLVNNRFGRDFMVARAQLAPIYEGAWTRARSSMSGASSEDAQVAALRLLNDSPIAAANNIQSSTPFSAYPAELATLRDELMQQAIVFGTEIGQATLATQKELERAGLSRLTALVEQQPQLLFSVEHDIRDPLTGPEKTSAKLTFEFTRYNFGSFMRSEGKACANDDAVREGGQAYDRCIQALNSYVGATQEALKTQPRWKLSAAYQRVDAISYSYPADNVSLNLPKTERLEVTAGWGRPLQAAVKNADRVDVEVSYDSNIDGDTSNKERLKATLTYTRRIAEMDMPFSIVYANKDEFLGEVDHKISLNLGIKFRPPAAVGK